MKPGNILVARGMPVEHAYVCDFGLARHVSSVGSLTGDRGFVGTIDYVSPEQIEGGSIDGRADVYSLGCVLFECLTGERPFERETELAVVFAHLNEPPPRLTDCGPSCRRRSTTWSRPRSRSRRTTATRRCGELVAAARAALRGETPRAERALAGDGATPLAGAARSSPPRPQSSASSRLATAAGAGARQHHADLDRGSDARANAEAYKELFGSAGERTLVTEPNFPALDLRDREQAIYFDPDRGAAHHHDLEQGPPDGGRDRALLDARGAEERVRQRTEAVAAGTRSTGRCTRTSSARTCSSRQRRPPNPSKHVTAVALYTATGRSDDGSGVDVSSGRCRSPASSR